MKKQWLTPELDVLEVKMTMKGPSDWPKDPPPWWPPDVPYPPGGGPGADS